MSTTFDHLQDLLTSEYQLAPERLTLDARLADLGIDSLSALELLWTLESALDITLPPGPVVLGTLGEVVRFVDQEVAWQGTGRVVAAFETQAAPIETAG